MASQVSHLKIGELDYLRIFVVTILRNLKTQHDRVLKHPCWFYQSKVSRASWLVFRSPKIAHMTKFMKRTPQEDVEAARVSDKSEIITD